MPYIYVFLPSYSFEGQVELSMKNQLLARKNAGHFETEMQSSELKRTLGKWSLMALGIGAIIGAGLFVRTASAAANNAGPAVVLGFIVAGIGCALAGLCYAEFASMIPIAGSAYTYSYATMGELVAWIIGWDLVLEYALGAATVSIAWSEYLNKLLGYMGIHISYAWSHSPFEIDPITSAHGIMNIPALFIIFLLTLLLIRGMQESSFVNGLIVITKVTIVILFIVLGWSYINPVNHTPFIPAAQKYVDTQGVVHNFGGIMGILGAAGVVFFAFIGFDAVSTAAQEAKDPKKDMPIGILGSLAICTLLYILFSYVLTGVASLDDFRNQGKEASVTYAIQTYMTNYGWLAKLVTIAILAGFSSVILVMLMGQSRVFFSMSRDGLVPKMFSDVHPKFSTPYKSNILFLLFVGVFAAFVPGDIVGDMTSIGTLFAFILVCAGVWIMRVKQPELPRAFKTPLVPLVPILGILVCGAMIYGLGWPNWLRLGIWMVIGFVIYFSYGIKNSTLNKLNSEARNKTI
jgi:APA family basic amino acid/polyamine antiporter